MVGGVRDRGLAVEHERARDLASDRGTAAIAIDEQRGETLVAGGGGVKLLRRPGA